MIELSIPEVPASPARARFFEDNGRPMVEISNVGQRDTVVRKVTPEDMARFKQAWDDHCDGRPQSRRSGTPLTDIPGIDAVAAQHFIDFNIHTTEELAAVSDATCQVLGHGSRAKRKSAQDLLLQRKIDRATAATQSVGRPLSQALDTTTKAEISDLNSKVDKLFETVDKLAQLLVAQPKKRGRPKGS